MFSYLRPYLHRVRLDEATRASRWAEETLKRRKEVTTTSSSGFLPLDDHQSLYLKAYAAAAASVALFLLKSPFILFRQQLHWMAATPMISDGLSFKCLQRRCYFLEHFFLQLAHSMPVLISRFEPACSGFDALCEPQTCRWSKDSVYSKETALLFARKTISISLISYDKV